MGAHPPSTAAPLPLKQTLPFSPFSSAVIAMPPNWSPDYGLLFAASSLKRARAGPI